MAERTTLPLAVEDFGRKFGCEIASLPRNVVLVGWSAANDRWRFAMKRIPKVAYTLEFKLEALRRVRGGEAVRQVGREIGVPEQSIRNWVKAQAAGKLGAAEKGRPITPEQMEISRLRSENVRLRMETEILGKAAAYFARESL